MAFSRFHLDPPPGFRGFDRDREITYYERNLPHWRQEGATYAVTFRLVDSLPRNKLDELKALRVEFEAKLEKVAEEVSKNKMRKAFASEAMSQTEAWLDRGYGDCIFRLPENRRLLQEALFFFIDERYELGAFVIMPNHVHMILRPFAGGVLEDILRSIKRASAWKINTRAGKCGPLWQEESHDRIIRDAEHLWSALQYIGRNPGKSGITHGRELRWVLESWQTRGWDFVDEENS